ncbi:MAG TPA: hypothetical protein PLV92_17700 [Pirellulaceae bacterium]|nr:hypothetical protein [Pirellulaceae bacterium]
MDRENLRVLMVAGAPSWDYQMVERLLLRDKSLTVSCWVQSQEPERERAGSRPLEELPSTRESLDWYDVVLLFDPDPDRLPPGWGDLLKAFAQQHAGGVCYMAGPRFASRLLTDAGSQSLRDLLPVKWNGASDFDAASLTVAQSRAWPLRPVASSSDHPLLRLAAEGRDEPEAWERLPGVFWSFPVGQVKPTARVLLEHGDPTLRAARGGRPLLVLGRYGAAQVAYLGLQGTWRWRRDDDGDSAWGERFWDRMVRQLAEGRSWEGSRRGWLRTDRERYEIGDRIVVTAKLQDAASTPLTVSRVEGEVVVDGSKLPITLAAVPDHPGEFSATWQTRQAGPHQFVVNLEDETGGEPLRLDVTAPVEPPRIESDATWLDRARLQQLAELSGGRYFDLEHLDQVLEAVPDRSETVEVRHPPLPLWDHVWTLLGFVAVLGAEWFLRQRGRAPG